LFGGGLGEQRVEQLGALAGRSPAFGCLQLFKNRIHFAQSERRRGGGLTGTQRAMAQGELALAQLAAEVRQRDLDFVALETAQALGERRDLGEPAGSRADLRRCANDIGKQGHAAASAVNPSISESSACSLSRSWRRSTIMSIAPFSSRNSAR